MISDRAWDLYRERWRDGIPSEYANGTPKAYRLWTGMCGAIILPPAPQPLSERFLANIQSHVIPEEVRKRRTDAQRDTDQ
jgi:hypothetical protein